MTAPQSEGEEGDYMSMVFAAEDTRFETSLAKRARLKKEAEKRAHPKSKEERAADEAEARSRALSERIDKSSKGYKLLNKLGYKPGTGLGPHGHNVDADTRLDPLSINIKEDRAGIGLDSERKRKFCIQSEEKAKRSKLEEDDFRIGNAKKQADRRRESLWQDAMAVLEQLEVDAMGVNNRSDVGSESMESPNADRKSNVRITNLSSKCRSPQKANLLYRALLRRRVMAEQEVRLRRRFLESPGQDLVKQIQDNDQNFYIEGELPELELVDKEDEELDDLEALEPAVRLQMVIMYLRDTYHYCFWCKCQYHSLDMEECPGPTEEDHD